MTSTQGIRASRESKQMCGEGQLEERFKVCTEHSSECWRGNKSADFLPAEMMLRREAQPGPAAPMSGLSSNAQNLWEKILWFCTMSDWETCRHQGEDLPWDMQLSGWVGRREVNKSQWGLEKPRAWREQQEICSGLSESTSWTLPGLSSLVVERVSSVK